MVAIIILKMKDRNHYNESKQTYLGKPIGLPSIFKPLLFNNKIFLDRAVVTPMDRN